MKWSVFWFWMIRLVTTCSIVSYGEFKGLPTRKSSQTYPCTRSCFCTSNRFQWERTWTERPLTTVGVKELVRYGELAQVTYDCFYQPQMRELEDGTTVINDNRFLGDLKKLGQEGLKFCYQYRNGTVLTEYDFSEEYRVVGNLYTPAYTKLFSMNNNSGSIEQDWQGFIALSTSKEDKEIVVSWRGTVLWPEWREDFTSILTKYNDPVIKPLTLLQRFLANFDQRSLRVHRGFLELFRTKSPLYGAGNEQCKDESASQPNQDYENGPYQAVDGQSIASMGIFGPPPTKQVQTDVGMSAQEYLEVTLQRLLRENPDVKRVVLTGHSLGAAMATLAGFHLAYTNATGNVPIIVYSFASPKVGNSVFMKKFNQLFPKLRHIRVVHEADIVPKTPFSNRFLPFLGGYSHTGLPITLSWNSLIIQDEIPNNNINVVENLKNAHNLELYIALLESGRDKSLLDKSINVLSSFNLRNDGITPVWAANPSMNSWPKQVINSK